MSPTLLSKLWQEQSVLLLHRTVIGMAILAMTLDLVGCGAGYTPAPAPAPSLSTLPAVSILPATAVVVVGSSTLFRADVTGLPSTAVTWSVQEGTPGGLISSTGQYTAPATIGSYHVVATSVSDPTKNAVATVTVVDNGFESVGTMQSPRWSHTATLLADGRVLLAGGEGLGGTADCANTVASAELFDPGTNTFLPTGNMTTRRESHTSTRLGNGRVLIAGGYIDCIGALASAELYDPANGTFTPAGSMSVACASHTATLLPSGGVIITGGTSWDVQQSTVEARAELYDPATGSFTVVGPMTSQRSNHTATLLPNGQVLIAGGTSTSTAELFNPATGKFTSTGSMTTVRDGATATLLADGRVLMVGGNTDSGAPLASAEIFDPATGVFSPAGNLTAPRSGHTATLLNDSTVLITGGWTTNASLATAELFDPVSGTFSLAANMSVARTGHTATRLLNGRVLVAGGSADGSAELYQK